jgi:hypothetical protein
VITYLKNSKGKEHLKLEKQLDPKLLVTIVMMLLVNVILKIEIFNLLFGFAWLIYFIVYYIRCCLKKDLCFEKELINEEYLFNSYIILYLISAIIKLNL